MDHDLAWWKEHYRAAGRSEGYSAAQIAEYRSYIILAERWIRLHAPKVEEEKAA